MFTDKQEGLFPLPKYVSVREAIGSFPPIPDGGGEDEINFICENPSAYDRLMAKEISFDEFYQIKLNEM